MERTVDGASCPWPGQSENPDVERKKPRRRVLNIKIKIHKESSGQRPCLSRFPRAANDQTIASHRERDREKQTGHACQGTSLEPIRKRTAQLLLLLLLLLLLYIMKLHLNI